jgi:hypothetical protein
MLTSKGDAGPLLAKPDQLNVRPRSRGESLDGYVQALEQVRLACAVGADREHDPRLQFQFQAGIRAVIPKREFPDDQPR